MAVVTYWQTVWYQQAVLRHKGRSEGRWPCVHDVPLSRDNGSPSRSISTSVTDSVTALYIYTPQKCIVKSRTKGLNVSSQEKKRKFLSVSDFVVCKYHWRLLSFHVSRHRAYWSLRWHKLTCNKLARAYSDFSEHMKLSRHRGTGN